MFPLLEFMRRQTYKKRRIKFCLQPLGMQIQKTLSCNCKSSGFQVAMTQTAQIFADQNPTWELCCGYYKLQSAAQSVPQAAALPLSSTVGAALAPTAHQPPHFNSVLRRGAEGRNSSDLLAKCRGQHSHLLWLAQFFKTLRLLGITLYGTRTTTGLRGRVMSSCWRPGKTGTPEKASIESVTKCAVRYHVAFGFHLSFWRSFLGQVGTFLPYTNHQSTGRAQF